MGFRNLFTKELKSIFPLFGVFGVAVVALHAFLLYKSSVWDQDVFFVLAVLIPFLFVSTLAVGVGYYQLHSEWKTNSIYLLLSLPVRGWKVLTAKLAAVLALLLAALLWIGASFALFLLKIMWEQVSSFEESPEVLSSMLNAALHSLWMYVLAVVFVLSLVQFAFLCSQFVTRLKWLVLMVAFFGALWLGLRMVPVVSPLLSWTPDFVFGGEGSDMLYLHTGPFIVLALLCVGLIWLNGYIFEKEVEV